MSTKLGLKAFGIPGEEHRLTITPVHENGFEPSPSGSAGKYRITFVLRRPDSPIEPTSNFDFDAEKHTGTSHVAISAPAARFADDRFNTPGTTLQIEVTTGDGRRFSAFASPNQDGYLSDVVLEMHASHFQEADVNARLLIEPVLSAISTQHDVPLLVSHIVIKEIATEVVQRTILTPFPVVAGANIPAVQSAEARTLIGYYRDALNSNDPEWRFLCFARIVEQLWKWQSSRNAAGENLNFDLERVQIPTDPAAVEQWVRSAFPSTADLDEGAINDAVPTEARGLTTNEVIVRYIRPLRADIAHGLFERGLLPPTKNDVEHADKVRKWLPMLRCIARVHLKAVFGFP